MSNEDDLAMQQQLKSLVAYDPETGIFRRLVSAKGGTKRKVGEQVGFARADGSLATAINGKHYPLDRLAVLYMTGHYFTKRLVHINGDRSDNVWNNLRIPDELRSLAVVPTTKKELVAPDEDDQSQPLPNFELYRYGYPRVIFAKYSGLYSAIVYDKESGTRLYVEYQRTAEEAYKQYCIAIKDPVQYAENKKLAVAQRKLEAEAKVQALKQQRVDKKLQKEHDKWNKLGQPQISTRPKTPIGQRGIDRISREHLMEILHYNPNSGLFTWIKPNSNATPVGSVAGWKTRSTGAWRIDLGFGILPLPKLAFLYMTGKAPDEEVVHINRDVTDMSWANLRLATRSEMFQDMDYKHKKNKYGYTGVCFNPVSNKYYASITYQGRNYRTGLVDTPEQAGEDYKNAKSRLSEFVRENDLLRKERENSTKS